MLWCMPAGLKPSSPAWPQCSLLTETIEHIEIGPVDIDTHGYSHYLHHKYFEVNYADGVLPLDKWFGSFHDGTPQGDAAMKARRLMRSSSPVQSD